MKSFLLFVFFLGASLALECNRFPTGICCDDGTCDCQPFYRGPNCETIDRCMGKDCGPHGGCDPSSGLCLCDGDYMGPNCDVKNCGMDGVYKPSTKMCSCIPGYRGNGCTECVLRPESHPHKVFICCPLNVQAMGSDYRLLAVHEQDLMGYLSGKYGFKFCVMPNMTIHTGTQLDCACRNIPTQDELNSVNVTMKESYSLSKITNPAIFYQSMMEVQSDYVLNFNNPVLFTELLELQQMVSFSTSSADSSTTTLQTGGLIMLGVLVVILAVIVIVVAVLVTYSFGRNQYRKTPHQGYNPIPEASPPPSISTKEKRGKSKSKKSVFELSSDDDFS